MSNSRSTTVDIKRFAAFGTIMSALAIGALVGNIICFRMTRRLLRNKPSLALVLNLNTSDIIVACVSWIGFMFQHIATLTGVGIHVIVHKVFWSIIVALGNVTLFTLAGLAGDCFIALRWPLHYKGIATYRCINTYIGLIWICSVLAGGSDFLIAVTKSSKDYSFGDVIHDSMVFTGTDRTVGDILTASITMLMSNLISFICLIVMAFMYAYILMKIRQIHSDRTLSKQGGFKSEIHAVRTTLMIFTSFLLLWLPTLIINIISVAKPNFLSKLDVLSVSIIGHIADSLLMVHSMVDALIYGVRVKKSIRRQRKSRKSQAGYSRANTLRKLSSDSERTPPGDQDETTNDTVESDLQQRRLSTGLSFRGSKRKSLTTISEKVEAQATDTPPSEDSGINSPHKLSPHNPTKCSQIGYIINAAVCYSQHVTLETEDGDECPKQDQSIINTFESIADIHKDCEDAAQPNGTHIDVSDIDGNICVCPVQPDYPHSGTDGTNRPTLVVPKATKPLRSSLKKTKRGSNSSTPEGDASHVQFSFQRETNEQELCHNADESEVKNEYVIHTATTETNITASVSQWETSSKTHDYEETDFELTMDDDQHCTEALNEHLEDNSKQSDTNNTITEKTGVDNESFSTEDIPSDSDNHCTPQDDESTPHPSDIYNDLTDEVIHPAIYQHVTESVPDTDSSDSAKCRDNLLSQPGASSIDKHSNAMHHRCGTSSHTSIMCTKL